MKVPRRQKKGEVGRRRGGRGNELEMEKEEPGRVSAPVCRNKWSGWRIELN